MTRIENLRGISFFLTGTVRKKYAAWVKRSGSVAEHYSFIEGSENNVHLKWLSLIFQYIFFLGFYSLVLSFRRKTVLEGL